MNQAMVTNVYGPWRLSQAFIPVMKRNGYGRIINISSLGGSLHYMQEGVRLLIVFQKGSAKCSYPKTCSRGSRNRDTCQLY